MRNELPFRRIDNNITTQMRYDMEAAHWEKSHRSLKIAAGNSNPSDMIQLIGAIITVLLSALIIICTFCFQLFRDTEKGSN